MLRIDKKTRRRLASGLGWNRAVQQIRDRNAALEFFLNVSATHPLGVVPFSVAARILGISRSHLHKHVSSGRLQAVNWEAPNGKTDRFVTVASLINAPFRANIGRPGLYGGKIRGSGKKIFREDSGAVGRYDNGKTPAKQGRRKAPP